jgi:dTDP-4-amino-4,6-dideoxygalactose transaminase
MWRKMLPDFPERRYTVLGGTNLWREWPGAWSALLGPRGTEEVVRQFEAEAARRCGCRHAIAFGAGRMGLYAILESLGLGAGDEVILPGFTCTVVPNAFVYRGVKPVYADISPVTFNIDPDRVEALVTPRTRAICMQHTFGVSCDAGRLREIARRHGLVLIEDAAHSLGATHGGVPHGALGDVAFVSTDRTKVINTHLGGFATTNDDALAAKLAGIRDRSPALARGAARRAAFSFLAEFSLRQPEILWIGRPALGALRRAGMLFQWTDEEMNRLPEGYPYPCRLEPAQARVGLSQLAALDANLRHRRMIAKWLEERIGWNGAALPGRLEEQAWLRYSFLVRDRDEFVARFGRRIELGIWFPTVIFQREKDTEAVGYRAGDCPVAENVARRIVNLPTHPRIPLALIESLWKREGVWLRTQLVRL